MGWIRIRDEDVRQAKSLKYRDDTIDDYNSAAEMQARIKQETKRLGVKVVEKPATSLKWSKLSTAFYRYIRVRTGFYEKGLSSQIKTLFHELVHSRQWRGFGRVVFALSYISSPRFRWIVEMQAYCESIAIMKAMRFSPGHIQRYIRHYSSSMLTTYGLKGRLGLNESDVRRYTKQVLNAAAAA